MIDRIHEARLKFLRQVVPFENKPTYLYISSDLLKLLRDYSSITVGIYDISTVYGLEVVEIEGGTDILFVG